MHRTIHASQVSKLTGLRVKDAEAFLGLFRQHFFATNRHISVSQDVVLGGSGGARNLISGFTLVLINFLADQYCSIAEREAKDIDGK